jgi:hypothetical protein
MWSDPFDRAADFWRRTLRQAMQHDDVTDADRARLAKRLARLEDHLGVDIVERLAGLEDK